jgi:4'-phosphopantetheinyl transferase
VINVYWLEQSEADIPQQNLWLSANEVLRLDCMRFPKRRTEWRLGRWTAKNAVAQYLQLGDRLNSLAELEIRSGLSGAPEGFIDNKPAAVAISLSHRSGKAACAIAAFGVAIGCDLEIVEPHSDAFLSDYFTMEEQILIASAANRNLCATLIWSAKEGALKALGEGLRLDTRSVIVSPSRASFGTSFGTMEWHSVQVRHESGRVFYGWWQASEGRVRTLVGSPAPMSPIFLHSLARTGTAVSGGSVAA